MAATERAQQLAAVGFAIYQAGGASIHVPLDGSSPLVAVLHQALVLEGTHSNAGYELAAALLEGVMQAAETGRHDAAEQEQRFAFLMVGMQAAKDLQSELDLHEAWQPCRMVSCPSSTDNTLLQLSTGPLPKRCRHCTLCAQPVHIHSWREATGCSLCAAWRPTLAQASQPRPA